MVFRANVYLFSLLVWASFILLAMFNGSVREYMITPHVGEHYGQAVSIVILSLAILAVSYAYFSLSPIAHTQTELLCIGIIWMVLTIVFEFTFFTAVMGEPVSEIIGSYNILRGRIWVLVPLTTLIAPSLVGRTII